MTTLNVSVRRKPIDSRQRTTAMLPQTTSPGPASHRGRCYCTPCRLARRPHPRGSTSVAPHQPTTTTTRWLAPPIRALSRITNVVVIGPTRRTALLPTVPPYNAHLTSLFAKKTPTGHRILRNHLPNTYIRCTTLSGTNTNRKSVEHSTISANTRLGNTYWRRSVPIDCVLTSRSSIASELRQAPRSASPGTIARPGKTPSAHTDATSR